MPTDKKRVNVTIEVHEYELLKRLAELQNVSMASIMTDLFRTTYPVLERVCVAVEQAKNMQDSVKKKLLEAAEESEKLVIPHLEASLGQLDIFLNTIEGLSDVSEKNVVQPKKKKRKNTPAGPRKKAPKNDSIT